MQPPSQNQCRNCYWPSPATGLTCSILICAHKQASQGRLFVVEPNQTCPNFLPADLKNPHDANVRFIPLTQGKFAIVDAEDYDRLSQYQWYASKCKNTFYALRHTGRATIVMHRQIMHAPKGVLCDHKNHNGLDNRKTNLRLCTNAQNSFNRKPKTNGTSKYKGVCWHKSNRKWSARVSCNGRLYNLGYFDNQIDAAIAYDRKAEQIFGEFAYLNFPALRGRREHIRRLILGE